MSPRAEPFTDRTALSHRIREELERVRASESASLDALDRLRQARVRLEALVWELGQEEDAVRALVREELDAAGWSRPAALPGTLPGTLSGPGAPQGAPSSGAPTGVPPEGSEAPRRRRAGGERSLGVEGAEPAELADSAEPAPPRRWQRPRGDAGADRRATAAAVPGPMPRLPKPPTKAAGEAGRGISWGPGATELHLPSRTSAPPLPPTAPSSAASVLEGEIVPDAPPARSRNGLFAVVLLALLGLSGIGWLAYRATRDDFQAPVVVGDQVVGGQGDVPAGAVPAPEPVAEPEERAGPTALAMPADAAARVVLYDSLWSAHSPLFDPLLASLGEASRDREVRRAIADWRAGETLSVSQADQLHSAFVQQILRAEINPRITLDGAILRNPCRGTSCSALLNLWQTGREKYGFPEVPEEAPEATDELRQVETTLVLSRILPAAAAAAEPR